ncbi:MAG: hypothetical protein LBK95_06210 [Bifidobacteriaceae bacterium]|jgi:hypothetical protein|nr:hypothetical protein [Bifidobacteriaceae bacterium]
MGAMGLGLEASFEAVSPWANASDEHSWLLHRALVGKLEPVTLAAWRDTISPNLDHLCGKVHGEPHRTRLAEWRSLCQDTDLSGIRRALLATGDYAKQMRDVSPFTGILDQSERLAALAPAGPSA